MVDGVKLRDEGRYIFQESLKKKAENIQFYSCHSLVQL